MSRIIKFRARVIKTIWSTDFVRVSVEKGQWFYFTLQELWINLWQEFIDWETLGQFIGLPDKDGKEIYGGDIVDMSYINDSGEVIFGEFNIADPKGEMPIEITGFGIKSSKDGGYFELSTLIAKRCKIIGNIYENPELL
jgi:uncharacterized phage protein (TIGR01671 family)